MTMGEFQNTQLPLPSFPMLICTALLNPFCVKKLVSGKRAVNISELSKQQASTNHALILNTIRDEKGTLLKMTSLLNMHLSSRWNASKSRIYITEWLGTMQAFLFH